MQLLENFISKDSLGNNKTQILSYVKTKNRANDIFFQLIINENPSLKYSFEKAGKKKGNTEELKQKVDTTWYFTNLSVKEIKNGYMLFDENFSLEMTVKDFDLKKHKITKSDGHFISKISDARPWGIEGDILPEMNELDKVIVTYNKVKIPFPKEVVKNMFQFAINTDYIGVSKFEDRTYFFYSQNSDGAGAY